MSLELIKSDIDAIIKEIDNAHVSAIYAHIASGKMLRSKLILKIAGVSERSIRLCSIIELIHMASLLHDDVIDEADTRRNQPSINHRFGDFSAIMMGDILYSTAFVKLGAFEQEIIQIVANAVKKLSIGELLDVELAKTFNDDEALYLDMIYQKTSALIEAASMSSAILAGKEPKKFQTYGKNLGVAFQIVDDILDIISDEATLGKPALNDFKEGKSTLPYIYLYHDLEKNEQERLLSLHKQNPTPEDSAWIKAKMFEHKSIQKSQAYVTKLSDDALNAIKDQGVNELKGIVKSLVDRDY